MLYFAITLASLTAVHILTAYKFRLERRQSIREPLWKMILSGLDLY